MCRYNLDKCGMQCVGCSGNDTALTPSRKKSTQIIYTAVTQGKLEWPADICFLCLLRTWRWLLENRIQVIRVVHSIEMNWTVCKCRVSVAVSATTNKKHHLHFLLLKGSRARGAKEVKVFPTRRSCCRASDRWSMIRAALLVFCVVLVCNSVVILYLYINQCFPTRGTCRGYLELFQIKKGGDSEYY